MINPTNIRLSFLDTGQNVGRTEQTSKVGRFSDIEFEKADAGGAPGRTSSLGERLKAGFIDLRNKIADSLIGRAFEKIESKISAFKDDVRQWRLEKQTTNLAGSEDGKAIGSKPTMQDQLEIIRPHGSAGTRVLADRLVARAFGSRSTDTPLDLTNNSDKQIFDKLKASIITLATSRQGGGVETPEAAEKNIADLLNMVEGAKTKSSPPSLEILSSALNVTLNTVNDEDATLELAKSQLETNFTKLGPVENFMRANTDANRVIQRACAGGVRAAKDEVSQDVRSVLGAPNNKSNVQLLGSHFEKIIAYDAEAKRQKEEAEHLIKAGNSPEGIVKDNPKPVMDRQTIEAHVDLAVKVLDEVIGEDGEKLIDRLGKNGIADMQEIGTQLIRLAKENGESDEVADKKVRLLYVNALFLRGVGQQLAVVFDDKQPVEKSIMVVVSADLQTYFNEIDPLTTKGKLASQPVLAQALSQTDVPQKLGALYERLGLPTVASVARGNQDFAERIGSVVGTTGTIGDGPVGGQYETELGQIYGSVDLDTPFRPLTIEEAGKMSINALPPDTTTPPSGVDNSTL